MNFKDLRKYLFSKNKIIFCECFLDKVKKIAPQKEGLIFERLDAHDIELFDETLQQMDFKSEFNIKGAVKRLQKGYFCYVAKKQNRIIGYCWWAANSFHIPYFDGTIELRPDEIYCFNNYIDKKYRGLGIFNMLRSYAYNELRSYGYCRDILCYFLWNKAAKRVNEKFGYSSIGSVIYGYIGTVSYLLNNTITIRMVFRRTSLDFWKKLFGKIRKR